MKIKHASRAPPPQQVAPDVKSFGFRLTLATRGGVSRRSKPSVLLRRGAKKQWPRRRPWAQGGSRALQKRCRASRLARSGAKYAPSCASNSPIPRWNQGDCAQRGVVNALPSASTKVFFCGCPTKACYSQPGWACRRRIGFWRSGGQPPFGDLRAQLSGLVLARRALGGFRNEFPRDLEDGGDGLLRRKA